MKNPPIPDTYVYLSEPRYKMAKLIEIESLTTFRYFEFSNKGEDTPTNTPTVHDMWEIIYVDRGECDVVSDGQRYHLSQGDISFRAPGIVQYSEIRKGGYINLLIITFSCSSPAMSYFENCHIHASREARQHISLMLHEASLTFTPPFIKHPTEEQKKSIDSGIWAGEQSIVNRLELLLIDIVRSNRFHTAPPKIYHPKEIMDDEFCNRVIDYMEKHLYDGMNIDKLCHAMSFSKSYLSKRFSSVCGCSLIKYFNIMRIQEAKRLIRETDLSFQEISEKMMLANPHYFSTIFKKHIGMTPTEYKKSCTKEWHHKHDHLTTHE